MPEQSVGHQRDAAVETLTTILTHKGETYENHRQRCAGRIQRRH